MYTQGTRSKGQILIVTMLIMAALITAGAVFLRNIFTERISEVLFVQKEKAFYIAEAGIEEAKSVIAANPAWFTDNPHHPDDDASWLINSAKGTIKQFGGGSYKIVRESGNDSIYSVSSYGQGRAVIRVKFIQAPFSTFQFKIL